MNPTPAEIIDGVRRILKDVVEPHVESPYALSRLAEVRAVLTQVDWNNSLPNIVEHNSTLAKLGQQALDWLESLSEQPPNVESLESALRTLLTEPIMTVASFERHNARRHEWDSHMVRCSNALLDWLKVHPEDEQAKGLLDSIYQHYSRTEG